MYQKGIETNGISYIRKKTGTISWEDFKHMLPEFRTFQKLSGGKVWGCCGAV
jgi:hypothetical protein